MNIQTRRDQVARMGFRDVLTELCKEGAWHKEVYDEDLSRLGFRMRELNLSFEERIIAVSALLRKAEEPEFLYAQPHSHAVNTRNYFGWLASVLVTP